MYVVQLVYLHVEGPMPLKLLTDAMDSGLNELLNTYN